MKRAGISLLLFVMQRLELLEAGRTDNIDVGNWRMEGRAQENSTIVVFFLSVAVASVVTMVSTVNRRTFAGSSGRSRFGTVSSRLLVLVATGVSVDIRAGTGPSTWSNGRLQSGIGANFSILCEVPLGRDFLGCSRPNLSIFCEMPLSCCCGGSILVMLVRCCGFRFRDIPSGGQGSLGRPVFQTGSRETAFDLARVRCFWLVL